MTTQLAKLTAKRDTAARRIGELEAAQRQAVQAREAARAAVIEFERRGGGRRAERAELETALNEAEAAAAERWPDRLEGARRATRDADREVQVFVYENLREVVEPLEEDGRIAAGNFNAAAEALIAAHRERERVASQITGLAAMTGRPRPGDVSRSRGEAVVRAATDLLAAGGEVPPKLLRDPRQPANGELVEAAS